MATTSLGSMAALRIWLCSYFLILSFSSSISTETGGRFEYKYSFKGPYLSQRDGTIPFWEHGENAQPSDDLVRLTSSLKSQKGFIWNKKATTFKWWKVEMEFKIYGRGRLGADGMAFWFTEQKGVKGPIFGSNDKWKGLGIMFDSFDNDNKNNNPYISAVVNDGNMEYNHEQDGSGQNIAGCLRDYRNKANPAKARIEYLNNVLTVEVHDGSSKEESFEFCMRVENIKLPEQGYFGLSSATGGLADDHDVSSFLVYSLGQMGQVQTPPSIPEDQLSKLSQEYDQFNKKLEEKKEEYGKQHPEKMKPEQKYEVPEVRELRQIYDGQNAIFRLTRELNHKCDEIIGRQERTISLVQNVQSTGGSNQGGNVPVTGTGANRYEVDTMLSNQRELIALARDIKGFVAEVQTRVAQGIGNTQQKQGGSAGFDGQVIMHEIRDSMNGIRKDISTLSVNSNQGLKCPNIGTVNCITTTYFIIFILIQIGLFIGYVMFKNNKEAQAKKFY